MCFVIFDIFYSTIYMVLMGSRRLNLEVTFRHKYLDELNLIFNDSN